MYQQTTQKQVKAARGVSKQCSICSKKFELFLREHICKRCLRPVCNDCSPKKLIIVDYDLNPKDKHRVCVYCKSESKFQKHLRKENNLQFGVNSCISLRWLQSLNIITTTESHSEIHDLEESYNKARSKELIQNIDVARMKKHLSYSFREFAHNVQGKDVLNDDVSKQLVGLLNKLAYRFDWKTLPNRFHLIAYFFLSFASESLAFHLLVEIYTNYIPNYAIEFMNDPPTSSDRSLTQNQKTKIQKILNYLISQYKYQDFEQKQVQSFIMHFGLELVASLYVDMLSVECFYTAIDDMVTKNTFMEIERTFIMITRFHHEFINKCSPTSKEEYQTILLHLIRNTSLNTIKDKCKGEKTFDMSGRADSFESKIFKGTQSLINMEGQKNMLLNDPQVQKTQSMVEKSGNGNFSEEHKINGENSQLPPPPPIMNNENQQEMPPPMMNPEQISQPPPMMNPEQTEQQIPPQMNNETQENNNESGNVTESDTSSSKDEKEEQEQEYNIKYSIQYAAIDQHKERQLQTTPAEDIQAQNKQEEIYKSEISFYQRSLLQKEKEVYEKNEQIKNLQAELKITQRQNNNFEDLMREIKEKDIIIEQLTASSNLNEEKLKKLETSQAQSAQHPHNNECLDKLWKQIQSLQKRQEEIKEEKIILEQDLLTQKEEILVKHLRETALLKAEIEDLQKQLVNTQEKQYLELTQNLTKIESLEKSIQDKNIEIQSLTNDNNSLKSQITNLQESETLLKQQISQKTELSITYSQTVDVQVKELQNNLESMRASNSSLIQEHKTLMDLTVQNNNLVFEELKLQIAEHVQTISEQNTSIEQGIMRETILSNNVKTQEVEIISLKTEIEKLTNTVQHNVEIIAKHEANIAQNENKIFEQENNISNQLQSITSLQQNIQEQQQQIETFENTIKEDTQKINQFEQQVRQQEDLIEDLRNQLMEKAAQYKTDLELITNSFKEEQMKRKDVEKLSETTQTTLDQTIQELNLTKSELSQIKVDLEKSQQSNANLESETIELKNLIQNQLESIQELQKESEDKSIAITGCKFEIAAHESTIKKSEEEIQELKQKLDNRCEEHTKTINKQEKELNRVNLELNKYLSIFQSVKQTVTNVQDGSQETNDD